MKKGEFRIAIALFTVILTVAILFGGYSVYNVYGIEKPVKTQLSSLQPVSDVAIAKEKKIYEIKIELEAVENLQVAYNNIEKPINQRFTENDYDLLIIDKRNEKLDRLYAQLQPAVQQAAAQSEFVWLNDQLSAECSQMDLKYNLWVDEKKIYVQIQDGDHYLYEIIERSDISSRSFISQ